MITRLLPALLLLSTTACADKLLMPSPSEQSRIQQALAFIQASPDRLPFTSEPLGVWFAQRVEGVYINEKHPEYDAYRDRATGKVFVSANLTAYDIPRLAATLLHEARHADVSHTCGLKDLTTTEWGAWMVQAWFLERNGYEGDAASIKREWVCQP